MNLPTIHQTTFLFLAACLSITPAGLMASESSTYDSNLHNSTAYIPSQCYTKTETDDKQVQNPCYVCHTKSVEPNYINDQDLQQTYSFPEAAQVNPWLNLFEDRSERVASISDTEILSYIRASNYFDTHGAIILAKELHNPPGTWDYNNNNKWDGYSPDCYFSFDSEGFDHTPKGTITGWRAFGYHPLPSTFWPTNGSTDDVMIRLPDSFLKNAAGVVDRDTYKINLAIVEALITQRDVAIPRANEAQWNVDLNNDGTINSATHVSFHWPDDSGNMMRYVGLAGIELQSGTTQLAAGLFPVGTEFLHSVRYLDIKGEKQVTLSPRMKELRYMKKRTWQTYADLEENALSEMKERVDFPDRVTQFIGNSEQGVNNGTGWLLQGFIEDAHGDLRPQTYEETVYCAGCHGGIGITTDSVFAFPRKIASNASNGGWFYWGDNYLTDIKEPVTELHRSGAFHEYSYYLMYNSSGSDLRSNPEIKSKFVHSDNSINYDELKKIQNDVSYLLIPSHERALLLNKAYKTIVMDQDFVLGRDVNVKPIETVHQKTDPDQPTGVTVSTNPILFANGFGQELHNNNNDIRLSKERLTKVYGRQMSGPDGTSYGVHLDGSIAKSSYQGNSKDIQMLFPQRLTLPTRQIIPTEGNPSCAACHRTIDGSENSNITATPSLHVLTEKGNNHSAKISPDGNYIAYVSDRTGQEQIWLMNSDGSGKKQITFGPKRHGWPDWKSDSSTLVYLGQTQINTYDITTYDISGGKETLLIASEQKLARPAFHPDANINIVAYAGLEGKNWDLWLVDANKKKTRLTSHPDMESNPLWSPDGTKLAYKVAPADAKYGLTIQNFLTFENGYEDPTVHSWQGVESVQMNDWSPDGNTIAYTAEVISDTSGEAKVTYTALVSDIKLDTDTAIADETRFISKGYTLGDRGPLFSPNGNKVLFWGWNQNLHAGLWLFDRKENSTTNISISGDAMYPQWSTNGRAILFESRIGDNTQLVLKHLSSNVRTENGIVAH